jgi:aminoglycoside phosphotransferase (APT) family kinase protein
VGLAPDGFSEEVPDLGPVPERLTIGIETAGALVAQQFPQWAELPLAPVADQGWDNSTFRLGDDLLVRLPNAAEYALAVEKEQRWLPKLAAHLPVPVPVPLGVGRPGAGFPFPWSVYRWLPGRPADRGSIADPVGVAADLAEFITALQRVDAADGPRPGIHNWFRGGTLRTYDPTARSALARLDGHLDLELATAAWKDALAARWDGVEAWFHGDLAPGNLLLDKDSRLTAVIDFGTCGVGDPSCDYASAWTLLDAEGRHVLRERLDIDPATWARGRGWALWKSLSQLAAGLADDEPWAVDAQVTVDEVLDDYRATR